MKPTAYIVGAGDFAAGRFSPAPGDFVIAADAGYKYLLDLDVTPDLVLGDFDSLGSVPDRPGVTVCPVEKDDTDMLIAIRRALELGYERLILLGGVGGRLDHTLANLQCVADVSRKGAECFLLAEDYGVTAVTDGRLVFPEGYTGGYSIFCHGDHAEGVFESGCHYPLNDASLTCFYPLGVSNEFAGGRCEISVGRGTLIVLWRGNAALPLPEVR